MSKQTEWARRYQGAALVTGASSGLGRDFARSLAERGMDLVLVARRQAVLEEIAAALRGAHGVRVEVVAEDLIADGADLRVYERVQELGIDIGLLVNNAGFGTYGSFQEQDPVFEGQMVDLNCRAPVLLTHRFLPEMVARKCGGIIIVASMAGYQPTPFFAVYGATKAFDLSFGEALWGELKGSGVDVVTLAPGVVQTGFQAVANSHHLPFAGQECGSREVVEETLEGLGRYHLVTPGVLNRGLAWFSQFVPRRLKVTMSVDMMRPRDSAASRPQGTDDGAFQRDASKMLLTFFGVVLLDLVVFSLFTGKLRLWFPIWIDPQWETDPEAWVVYSQSYIAGIAFIPWLYRMVDRDFLRPRIGVLLRIVTGLLAVGILGFVGWWKGGLMLAHGKEWEALGFVTMTVVLWTIVHGAEQLGRLLTGVTRMGFLRLLILGVALFFLVMAVLDPAMQVGVQGLDWSTGLRIEVGFFVPAGLLLVIGWFLLGRRS